MEPRPAVGCATTEGPEDQVRLGERRNWSGPTVCPGVSAQTSGRRACRQSECGRTESGGTAESGGTGGPVASRGEIRLNGPRCGESAAQSL